MNTNTNYEYDLVEIEAQARQMRAEALRHGVAGLKEWIRSFFLGRSGATAGQA